MKAFIYARLFLQAIFHVQIFSSLTIRIMTDTFAFTSLITPSVDGDKARGEILNPLMKDLKPLNRSP